MPYCPWCRNIPTEGSACEACALLLGDTLKTAARFFEEAGGRYSSCCAGLNGAPGVDFPHLYKHSDDFTTEYYPIEGNRSLGVSVEAGIKFYPEAAECYFIIDQGDTVTSEAFGDPVPYTAPDFWERIDATLDTGAEVAFHRDWLSCEHCGENYYAGGIGHECEGAEE